MSPLTEDVEEIDFVTDFGQETHVDENSRSEMFDVARELRRLIGVEHFIGRQNQVQHGIGNICLCQELVRVGIQRHDAQGLQDQTDQMLKRSTVELRWSKERRVTGSLLMFSMSRMIVRFSFEPINLS